MSWDAGKVPCSKDLQASDSIWSYFLNLNPCWDSCPKDTSAMYTKLKSVALTRVVWRCKCRGTCCRAAAKWMLPCSPVPDCQFFALVLCLAKKPRQTAKTHLGKTEGSFYWLRTIIKSVLVVCVFTLHRSIACVTFHVKMPSRCRASKDHSRSRRLGPQIHGAEEECMSVIVARSVL